MKLMKKNSKDVYLNNTLHLSHNRMSLEEDDRFDRRI